MRMDGWAKGAQLHFHYFTYCPGVCARDFDRSKEVLVTVLDYTSTRAAEMVTHDSRSLSVEHITLEYLC